MKYRNLGRTGLLVSRLCLGTMNFGTHTPEPQAREMLSRAVDAGINFIDTADIYGWRLGEGLTEQLIGRWFAERPSRRDDVVLASKVYGPMGRQANTSRLSARHIRRACEGSLRRLGTDHLDLLQMHHVDRSTPWEEIWQALELLVAQGKVLYVGSSNFAGWHIARAQELAARRNLLGLVSEQSVYNLMERSVELEVLPACRAYGIGLLPYSPLHGGLLAGAPDGADPDGADPDGADPAGGRRGEDQTRERADAARDRIATYERLCRDFGQPPAAVALGWLLQRPGVTAPVIGPRTVEQLEGALRAVDLRLDDRELAALEELFPGPGQAPEAYAW